MTGICCFNGRGGLTFKALCGRGSAAIALIMFSQFLRVTQAQAQAPQLVSVTPANGATGVATDASIVFVFDQAMDTDIPLVSSFPPFLVGNFEATGAGTLPIFAGTWSGDGKTLTCELTSGEFPANSTVTWKLNPAGSLLAFANAEGTDLLATVTGSFTTGEGGGGGGDENCDGLPDSWGAYSVFKGVTYEQTSAADPAPSDTDAFVFGANVSGPEGGPLVTSASLSIPGGGTEELISSLFGNFFTFADTADTEVALDGMFPAGGYTLRFTQEGLGERVIQMTLPANPIPVPKVANYAEAQSVDAEQDFTLQWNSFTGSGGEAYISLSITEELGNFHWHAPDRCVPRELSATATSILIPANTLPADRSFTCSLSFGRSFYLSTNAVTEMSGFGGQTRSTTFSLSTGNGGDALPATLMGARVLANGKVEISLSGTAARVYTIERATDLAAPDWVLSGTVTLDAGGEGVFEGPAGTFPAFYRAVAN